ncbi:MAG: hypothetical protein ABF384_16035 [Verrucomicrobiales bacterium]
MRRKITSLILLLVVAWGATLFYLKKSLSFSPSVHEYLRENHAEVIFDDLLDPGEKVDLPDFVGATAIGYYVDEQQSIATRPAGAGGQGNEEGFVVLYGSDGVRSESAYGGEFRPADGASYWVVNEGRERRRFLVYLLKG